MTNTRPPDPLTTDPLSLTPYLSVSQDWFVDQQGASSLLDLDDMWWEMIERWVGAEWENLFWGKVHNGLPRPSMQRHSWNHVLDGINIVHLATA